jgi:DNA-binding NtrC family response regulator
MNSTLHKPIDSAGRARVLVVDHNIEQHAHHSRLMAAAGHDVTECGSVATALTLLPFDCFDLIVISQDSRRSQDRELIQRARGQRIPVIVVAQRVDMCWYLESMALGAWDYFVEPMSREQLENVIAHCVGVRRSAASASAQR